MAITDYLKFSVLSGSANVVLESDTYRVQLAGQDVGAEVQTGAAKVGFAVPKYTDGYLEFDTKGMQNIYVNFAATPVEVYVIQQMGALS